MNGAVRRGGRWAREKIKVMALGIMALQDKRDVGASEEARRREIHAQRVRESEVAAARREI